MDDRPYTLLSCSVSIDGYIGSAASRLLLSNDADFDRVDAVRASCDAILVGAATVRLDNPRLVVRSQARRAERTARGRLGPVATVVDGGRIVQMRKLSADLAGRGVERLMVEGGGKVHTQFLTDDLADELQLVVAPIFVGDSQAPRFVRDGVFPWNPGRRATLADVRRIGDVVLLRYALSPRFRTD